MEEMILLSSIWHQFGSEKGYSPACWLNSKSGKEYQDKCELRRIGQKGSAARGYFAPQYVANEYSGWLIRSLTKTSSLVCLNDVWKNHDAPNSRRPYLWLQRRGWIHKDKTKVIGNKTYATKDVAAAYDAWLCGIENNRPYGNEAFARIEHGALCMYEQLIGVKLIRQYKVLEYRIDGYDPVNNIAVEIDEGHHKGQEASDAIRQRRIEEALGCTFFRCRVFDMESVQYCDEK
ncbi:DUF559 domain-containing protein [Escherichia coli]|uniref:DUF559 domain-containing protein n=1 Tax=Escherichia coli TaxID=562 RepID=UPI00203C4201|nr:DUF559 domain-containing protein [Escherichia coli]